ncbi:MAG: arginine--tRNA ligase [Flavobacteriaceae bacterium]
MDVFEDIAARVDAALQVLRDAGDLSADTYGAQITVEPTRDPSHGDVATNAAMVLARQAGLKPRDLAEKIVSVLARHGDLSAEVAGPGFINIRLADAYWHGQLAALIADGDAYGKLDFGGGRKINVEYVSANPTGPMHVGHCRGAVFGDALANLLAVTGHDVTREYYINDAGAQIDVLARSAFLRYRQALGDAAGDIPEGLYPGEYLVPVGQRLADEHGRSLLEMEEAGWLPIVRRTAVEMMMDLIREDLAALNVRHDVFFSEATLHAGNASRISGAIAALQAQGYVYTGTLPPPKGQLPEDWEDREQVLFRSTDVGDDIDRPLVKSDGAYTYFAADVAYFQDKFLRGFEETIYVLGADHGGYVKRLEALARAISGGTVKLTVKLCQLVKLFRAGEPVRMSKRAGDFVTLRDVVDEVGRDVVRFMMLYRKNEAPLDFDFARVVEQSRDNPVFYVQYAHARAKSVLRNVLEVFPDIVPDRPFGPETLAELTDEAEIALIRRLAQYRRILEASARAEEPHRIAFYLYELASDFHSLWNKGKDTPQLRFIHPVDRRVTEARMQLVLGVTRILAFGLGILGVEPAEEMR